MLVKDHCIFSFCDTVGRDN